MKPFFLFDFFETGGARVALAAGMALTALGLIVLFFPELLQALIGGALLAAGLPLLVYGLRSLSRRNPPRGGSRNEDVKIIFPEP